MAVDYKNTTDEQLFLLLKEDGDVARSAFNELYNRHSSRIYTYCRKILNNSTVANDIFQDTFSRLYEARNTVKSMSNLSGYLIKTARNLCLNERSRKNYHNLSIEDFQLPIYDKSFEKKELNEVVDIALEALPEQFREVIVLKEFLDMSYAEIAKTLNLTLPVVRIRIYRAKVKLREILAPYFKDYENNKMRNIQ